MKKDRPYRVPQPTVEVGFELHIVESFAQQHNISRTIARAILANVQTLAQADAAVVKMRGD